MVQKIRWMLCVMAAVAGMTACSSGDDGGYGPRKMAPEVKEWLAGQNENAEKIVVGVVENAGETDNPVVSPYSLNTFLSLIANATDENDTRVLLDYLGATDLESLNRYNQSLISELPMYDEKIRMDVANSVWAANNISVKPEYTATVGKWLNAEVNSYDPGDMPGSVSMINSWINRKTNGFIPEFFEKDQKLSKITFVNAIYFNGEWTDKFDKSETLNGPFFKASGERMSVPMMHDRRTAAYGTLNGATVCSLPFGNGSYRITFILPDEGVKEFIRNANSGWIAEAIDIKEEHEVELTIPRFKVDFGTLISTYISQELQIMFTAPHIYPGINETAVLMDNAIFQKVVFGIDEEGGRGAAVTANIDVISPGPGELKEFKLDRAFVYIVSNSECSAPLFIGVLNQPK